MARSRRLASLSYAVRLPVVGCYLGQLALALAVLTLGPLIAAVLAGDAVMAWRLAAVAAVLAFGGSLAARIDEPRHLQANEALVITALAFVLAPLAMTWPMMAADLGFIDAWFESVSAVTTTGLSTLASVEDKGSAFLFTRAWMQWYGGLGIVVLSLAILANHATATRRLLGRDSGEELATSTRSHARRVLAVYLALTALGLVLLLGLGLAPFTALVHVLAAVSTGGFTTSDASLAGLVPVSARVALMGVALLGAVSLPLYYRAVRGSWRDVVRDFELRGLLLLCLLISGALAAALVTTAGWSWSQSLAAGALNGVSAQTGSGFSSIDFAAVPDGVKGIALAGMFVGGSIGSTTGGIKLLRLLVLLRVLQLVIRRSALPRHAVADVRLGRRRLPDEDVLRALLLIVMFVAVIALSWLAFLLAGHEPMNALFEVVSATCTVGLSTGIAGPDLDLSLKAVLIADMLLGRVEFLALLVILFPGTWIGHKVED
ncbi:MAG: potassium transporter TrkG [Halofilum sp. (in: g-proteobacteria)]|nr:potassium transporter TrkG [Halofilum sp. (in: g-proteobacteria)]